VIVVESEADYNKWLASQKPEYFTLHPEKDPGGNNQAVDSTQSAPIAIAVPKSN
jgi:hypothetical protein